MIEAPPEARRHVVEGEPPHPSPHPDTSGAVRLTGSDNDIEALDLSRLTIAGDDNSIAAHGSINRVDVDGADNTVLADGEIGAVNDGGDGNTISSSP